nr:2-C-methyl-D-erythritol 4-phosphate cytidylyltransferase [Bacilli bacterium]
DHGDRFDFDYLRKEGFPDAVVEALKLLTHDPKVPYMDYVKAIKGNEIARRVKLADLRHNTDTSRLNGAKSYKHETYLEAIRFLED